MKKSNMNIPEVSCQFFEVKDVAEILGISKRSAYTLCNNNVDDQNPGFIVKKFGRTIRVNKDSFCKWAKIDAILQVNKEDS